MFIKYLRFRAIKKKIREAIRRIIADRKLNKPSFVNEDLETVLDLLPSLFSYMSEQEGPSKTFGHAFTNKEALDAAGGLVQMFFWVGIYKQNALQKELNANDDTAWEEIIGTAVQHRTMPFVVPMEFIDNDAEEFRDTFKKHLSDHESAERAQKFAAIFDDLLSGAKSSLFGEREKMFSVSFFEII